LLLHCYLKDDLLIVASAHADGHIAIVGRMVAYAATIRDVSCFNYILRCMVYYEMFAASTIIVHATISMAFTMYMNTIKNLWCTHHAFGHNLFLS
jgi:hypothetical protein